MSERLSSGHPRLDGLLGGGLPANAINVVIGLPGTGKTILAQQYVFANATPDRPALYMSTVSEPLEKLIRYAQTLDFFTAEAVGSSVFYEDLGSIVNEHGLEGVSERIGELIRERRPGIIVIDSFKALSAYTDASGFRRFLHDLAAASARFRPTASGSASTTRTRWPTRPSSPSPTPSSRSPPPGWETGRRAPCGCSSSGGARRPRARTPTASPRTGSTSSRGWPTPSRLRTTRSAAPASPPASQRSTSCWPTGTGRAPQRSAPARRDAGRRSWACTSSSTARAPEIRAWSPRSRRTRCSSSGSSAASAGRSRRVRSSSCTARPSTSTSTNGSTTCSTPWNASVRGAC